MVSQHSPETSFTTTMRMSSSSAKDSPTPSLKESTSLCATQPPRMVSPWPNQFTAAPTQKPRTFATATLRHISRSLAICLRSLLYAQSFSKKTPYSSKRRRVTLMSATLAQTTMSGSMQHSSFRSMRSSTHNRPPQKDTSSDRPRVLRLSRLNVELS